MFGILEWGITEFSKKGECNMIILLIVYNVIAVLCISYAIFNPKNVLSWLWVRSKTVCLGLYNWLKGFTK